MVKTLNIVNINNLNIAYNHYLNCKINNRAIFEVCDLEINLIFKE